MVKLLAAKSSVLPLSFSGPLISPFSNSTTGWVPTMSNTRTSPSMTSPSAKPATLDKLSRVNIKKEPISSSNTSASTSVPRLKKVTSFTFLSLQARIVETVKLYTWLLMEQANGSLNNPLNKTRWQPLSMLKTWCSNRSDHDLIPNI